MGNNIFAAHDSHVALIIEHADSGMYCRDRAAKELLEIGMQALRLARKALKKAKEYRTGDLH